jgi:hypothetical protein
LRTNDSFNAANGTATELRNFMITIVGGSPQQIVSFGSTIQIQSVTTSSTCNNCNGAYMMMCGNPETGGPNIVHIDVNSGNNDISKWILSNPNNTSSTEQLSYGEKLVLTNKHVNLELIACNNATVCIDLSGTGCGNILKGGSLVTSPSNWSLNFVR